jgi:hypothetical protein
LASGWPTHAPPWPSWLWPWEPVDLYRRGFQLYEQFRPSVPAGESGWGALGELDLAKVRALVPTD